MSCLNRKPSLLRSCGKQLGHAQHHLGGLPPQPARWSLRLWLVLVGKDGRGHVHRAHARGTQDGAAAHYIHLVSARLGTNYSVHSDFIMPLCSKYTSSLTLRNCNRRASSSLTGRRSPTSRAWMARGKACAFESLSARCTQSSPRAASRAWLLAISLTCSCSLRQLRVARAAHLDVQDRDRKRSGVPYTSDGHASPKSDARAVIEERRSNLQSWMMGYQVTVCGVCACAHACVRAWMCVLARARGASTSRAG